MAIQKLLGVGLCQAGPRLGSQGLSRSGRFWPEPSWHGKSHSSIAKVTRLDSGERRGCLENHTPSEKPNRQFGGSRRGCCVVRGWVSQAGSLCSDIV